MRSLGVAIATAAIVWAVVPPPVAPHHAHAAAAAKPTPIVFELTIANGRVVNAAETLRIKKGDEVELRWTTDRPIRLHLHGYDIERRVTPLAPSAMTFNARLTGRFPISEHHHGGRHERALVYLEVHP